MADLADSLTPLPGLPPEYQSELQRLLRQRAMAEAFQRNAFQPQSTQVINGVAVKQSPLGALSRALTGYLANNAVSSADTGLADVQKRAAGAQSQETQTLMGMTPQARIAAALASTNPAIRKLGETWQKYAQEASTAAGKGIIESGDTKGGLGILSSGQIPGDYQAPQPKPMETGSVADNPYAMTYDRKGNPTLKFAPKGIQFNLPGKEGEMGLDILKGQLTSRQTVAQGALDVLNSNRTAIEALNEGARTGGGEGIKQAIRKTAQAFGIQDAATAPTEKLTMALGDAVLAGVAKLRPASDKDIQFLKELRGSLNTDPAALEQMLAIANSVAYKELQGYHKFVDVNSEANLKTPYAADMFRSAKIGYEIPNPAGTQAQIMRMLGELKNRGGDVSQFAVGGEPLDPNSQFNISPRAMLPPQLQGTQPTPQQKPLTIDQLSPAQKEQLRKLLGG